MKNLKKQAPEEEKHHHNPTTAMASVSCAYWRRLHSYSWATAHVPEATVSNLHLDLSLHVTPSRFKVLGGCHWLTTFKSHGHVPVAERAGEMSIRVSGFFFLLFIFGRGKGETLTYKDLQKEKFHQHKNPCWEACKAQASSILIFQDW